MNTSAQPDLLVQLKETQQKLEDKNKQLELINQVGMMLTSELALEKLVQKVTDLATQISKAQFGALFYKKENSQGEEITLFTLSGADKEAFSGMHSLRNTPLLSPTFNGEGVIRSDDITLDPRYGHNKPHHGMPKGHLFLRSYLALPVISRTGKVLGGLFFGHPEAGIFTQYEEDLVQGIAAQAAVAIDNARLFEANVEAEQKAKTILESMPHIAWTSHADGSINYFNQRWYEYTGLLPEQSLASDYWKTIVHPDDLEITTQKWEQAVKTGVTFEHEYRLKQAIDNSYRWHLGRATPIKDSRGIINMWIGTCTDVQEVKQVQQGLFQKNMELMKSNSDLDSFVYTASHDLKGPVINIRQIIQELHAEANFRAEDAELLQVLLHDSLNQLQQTIQDLSEVVKVQKSQQEADEEINLERLLEEVKISLKMLILESNAQIETDFNEAPVIAFNRGHLKSILYNLVNNGLKYRSAARNAKIKIKSSLESGYVKISVADNGIGMNLENRQEKLFQMFSRFHDHVPGSGIGLYLVNRIIKNNGGYIEVQTKPEEGSTFHLFFKQDPKV